jgi:hypothetical protein
MPKPPRLVSGRQIVSIVLLLVCMVLVIVLKSRCGQAVGELFRAVEPPHAPAQTVDGASAPGP